MDRKCLARILTTFGVANDKKIVKMIAFRFESAAKFVLKNCKIALKFDTAAKYLDNFSIL